jgi:NAD-dependent SIR2 family protein deacetylase
LKDGRFGFIVLPMGNGRKIDKWVLRILGGENNNDDNARKSSNSSYEELLMQEEAHRQALEQQLLDAQHQREMSRIAAEAIALDRQIEKNIEFIAEFRRQNPTATSITNNGDSFEVTWDPSLNGTAKKSKKEVECIKCFKKTPAATFCSHCGQEL